MKHREFYDQHFSRDDFPDDTIEHCHFYRCGFDRADLSELRFLHCKFYDEQHDAGCSFYRATLKDTLFSHCDLSMSDFRHTDAIGLEISDCKAQGTDFRGASFRNMIGQNSYFCTATLLRNNFCYASFEDVILELCDLRENRWSEANLLAAKFSGSDLSGGEFHHIDWQSADFTCCDLTGCDLSQLDVRRVDLTGVKITQEQQSQLLEPLGIIVI
ncbi:Qnr family pentapeptide repeat protein [Pragia fontium]|uniref:Qnr family pentapeptide repeat protein n=1 Tax=Pragia fontium TaxID=82985 RepID=UPI000F6D2BE0|nr:Qnr family pentapeptide repeat protein [Pragia fontium]VEJ55293.1 secreted effector protein PipB [Pragia fontium]